LEERHENDMNGLVVYRNMDDRISPRNHIK